MIESQLSEAVKECTDAAAHEYDAKRQKLLLEVSRLVPRFTKLTPLPLQAASFGKTFCPDMESETFVRVCRELRVLNALRDRLMAIPLTYAQ